MLTSWTAAALSQRGKAGARTPPPSASESDALTLWYERPASQWVEALPVGNGRIGAMVFGGPAQERLQLNEDTLWAGGPYDPSNPEALGALTRVQELVFAGRYAEADALANQRMMARPLQQMSYESVGDLLLRFSDDATRAPLRDYRRALDLDTAIATVSFQQDGRRYLREVFASAVDQVIVIALSCDTRHSLNFEATFRSPTGREPAPLIMAADGDMVMRGRNGMQDGIAGALTLGSARAGRDQGGRSARQAAR